MQRPWQLLEDVIEAASVPVVAAMEVSRTTNLRWAVSTPTTNGDAWRALLTISAVAEVAGGWSAATRAGEPDAWPQLLAEAESAARAGSPASEGAPLLAGQSLAGYDSPAADGDPLQLPGELAEAFDDPDWEVFGYLEAECLTTYVATSTGWRWREVSYESRLEVSAKADARTRSAWSGRAGDTIEELDVASAIADVRRQLQWQRRSTPVPAQPTTAILCPSATGDLMLEIWRNAVARDAAEGRSAFTGTGPAGTALGQQLSNRRLTLRSDPDAPGLTAPRRLWTPWSSAARCVFDTGSELSPVDWIESGTLVNLAATRAAAGTWSLPFVASPDSLSLVDSDATGGLDDLVARTANGVLITSLWYIRDVDPQTMLVTGLTRDGCYRVVDGEVVGSAGNFRFNDSPLAMLNRVLDAGQTGRCLPREWADYFTRTAMPPLSVAEFGLSTESVAI